MQCAIEQIAFCWACPSRGSSQSLRSPALPCRRLKARRLPVPRRPSFSGFRNSWRPRSSSRRAMKRVPIGLARMKSTGSFPIGNPAHNDFVTSTYGIERRIVPVPRGQESFARADRCDRPAGCMRQSGRVVPAWGVLEINAAVAESDGGFCYGERSEVNISYAVRITWQLLAFADLIGRGRHFPFASEEYAADAASRTSATGFANNTVIDQSPSSEYDLHHEPDQPTRSRAG